MIFDEAIFLFLSINHSFIGITLNNQTNIIMISMAIFTRRGGSIVFLGFMCVAVAIAMAGYQAIGIITSTFLGDIANSLKKNGSTFASNYPDNSNLNAGSLGQIIIATLMEVMFQLIFNTMFTINTDVILYFMILGSMLIFSVVVGYPAFASGAGPGSVRLKRILGKEKAFAGDYLYVEVKVNNKSINPIPVIEIYDAYPEVFELSLGENFLTTQLGPKQTISFSYVVRIPIRGKFLIGPTKIIMHDRQGFFSDEAVLAELTELLVYPSYEDIKKLQMLGSKRQLGKMFGSHRTKIKGMGTDFFGLREYQPGDPLKFVHWASVGKSGGEKILVREFESEQNIRVVLLLDSSLSMGAGLPRNTKLEFAIRSCVMMAHLAIENKDTVGLCVADQEVRDWLEPTGSRNFMFRFLEVLANVEPRSEISWTGTADYLLPRIGKASYVIILSDLEGDPNDFIEACKKLRAAKHRLFVISPFGPWFETQQYDLTPMDRIMGEAIQDGLVQKRSELFKKLQNYEAAAISVGPNDMLANVMAEFQRIKQSS